MSFMSLSNAQLHVLHPYQNYYLHDLPFDTRVVKPVPFLQGQAQLEH